MDEDRAHDGGADRATNLAEEVVSCCSSTDHCHREGVLNDENQNLHTGTQTKAHDEQVNTELPQRSRRLQGGQQVQRHSHNHQTDERVEAVLTGARNNLAHTN